MITNKYLIALDLDDTLLNYEKKVSLKTKKYLKTLYDQGNIIIVISGRIFNTCYDVVSKLDFINYIVTDSGSLIYDNINKKIIYKKQINKSDIKKILNLYNDKIEYIEFSDEYYYYKYSKKAISHYGLSRDIGDIDSFIKKNNVIHSSIMMHDYNNNHEIINKITKNFRTLDVFEMKENTNNIKWLELVKKGVSKDQAITYIIKRENIKKDNVISFGDNYNDIDMIKNSKYGVAMGNAIDEVKKVASYVTKSCNNDGIEYFLRGFFNNNERIFRK